MTGGDKEMIEITVSLIIMVLAATLVAMLIRLYDYPATPIDYKSLVLAFVSSIVAAFLSAWISSEAGMDIYTIQGFAVLAGSAVGGISAIRALIDGGQVAKEVVIPVEPVKPA
jgi:hypothetical protein